MLKLSLRFVIYVIMFWSQYVSSSPETDTEQGTKALLSGDTVTAMRYYRGAAEQGYAPAQEKLANILDRAELNEDAIYWYQKAVEQNYPEAQYGLGIMYLTGDGTDVRTEEGIELVKTAAEQGLLNAMVSMLSFNENGEHGMQKDLEQAVFWLEKIAVTGNQWAIERLSKAYQTGELGLNVDSEKAAFWEDKLQKN